jgi:hypothetical protein
MPFEPHHPDKNILKYNKKAIDDFDLNRRKDIYK